MRATPALLVRAVLATTLVATGAPHLAATEAPLDGVYLGLRQNGMSGRVYQDYWTFFPDGRVMDRSPDEGLARPVDRERLCQQNMCGSWTRQGDAVRIRWDAGSEVALDVEAGGALRLRGRPQRYRPLGHLTGLTLDGTYAVVDEENDITLTRIDFTREGRFTETNLTRHTSWPELAPPGETREALPGGSGRYAITRNTLELRYDGGPVVRLFVAVPPGEAGNAVPEVLYLNESRIPRRP